MSLRYYRTRGWSHYGPCYICGSDEVTGHVTPMWEMDGDPDICYECYKKRRRLLEMEWMLTGREDECEGTTA